MKTLLQAHTHDACYFGDRPEWLIVLSQHRDSDTIERSNFIAACEMLGGESDTVAIERSSHWAVGWVEYLVIDPSQAQLVKQAEDIHALLEDYPLLDEMAYSELEHEEYLESWNSWGRDDYRRMLKSAVYDEYTDEYGRTLCREDSPRLDALKDAVDDLTDDELDELRHDAAQSVDWEYQSEGSGVTINIDGLARCTDMDKVIALCDEIIAEQTRRADITRLASHLGACPSQIAEAIALDIRSVSGLNALMQGSI